MPTKTVTIDYPTGVVAHLCEAVIDRMDLTVDHLCILQGGGATSHQHCTDATMHVWMATTAELPTMKANVMVGAAPADEHTPSVWSPFSSGKL